MSTTEKIGSIQSHHQISSTNLVALLAALLVTAAFEAESQAVTGVECWQDPVVTYTNGVRLASSTPLRSHNMYWQCDPEHHGYCNGKMYRPCRDDLAEIGNRLECGYRLPYGRRPRAVGSDTPDYVDYADGFEAVEMVDSERLGSIPNSLLINAAQTGRR